MAVAGIESETSLVFLCIVAASQSRAAVDRWRRQHRSLERLPSHLAEALLHRLLRRRLLFPSLLELFKFNVEEVDLSGESFVDAEWIAYLGGFCNLRSLNLSGCQRITSSALWPITGLASLRELDISQCSRVNNSGIKHLVSLQNLEKLYISGTGVTADGVKLVASLRKLIVLDLGGLPVSDQALSSLKASPKLKTLVRSHRPRKEDCISWPRLSVFFLLQILLKLSDLQVEVTAVSNEAKIIMLIRVLSMSVLVALKVLKNLEHLDVWGSSISDKGVPIFGEFHRLSFLNLAWTKLTTLPNLKSLGCLNMSNCIIKSVVDVHGDHSLLRKLILHGASLTYDGEVFSYIDSSSLSFLDISNTDLDHFGFLDRMHSLEHLDLSSSMITDDSMEIVACIGTNLKHLNLKNTRVSSVGVGILAGHVPHLEFISLSGTPIDDHALAYISLMPSLEVVDLSITPVKGHTYLQGHDQDENLSLAALQDLQHLKRLDLSGTFVTDAGLLPLSGFHELAHLSLMNASLTSACLPHLSSMKKLVEISIRDALLGDDGLNSFNPPPTVKVLDIRGCWLLTEGGLKVFCGNHPELEVRHELVEVPSPSTVLSYANSPLSRPTSQGPKSKKQSKLPVSPSIFKDDMIDQRIKYTRDELLALQGASSSSTSDNICTARQRNEKSLARFKINFLQSYIRTDALLLRILALYLYSSLILFGFSVDCIEVSGFSMGTKLGVIFLFLSYLALYTTVSALSSDGQALLSLSSKWDMPVSLKLSWNASHSTPCSWVGVQCDNITHSVVSLNLSSIGISGLLGPEIGRLRDLNTIDLSNNYVFGPVPVELSNCSLLQYLDLSVNNLTGEVPWSMGLLQNLQYLNLYGNLLSGLIPDSLFRILSLQYVYLNSNELNGSIPSNVGNLTGLVALWLDSNQLSGTVDASIGNLSSLEELYLNDNQLVGVLPRSLNDLENLIYLDVSSNNLEGTIHFGSSCCKNLNTLVLSFNHFSGALPDGLGMCSSLTTLAAVGNNLTGSIPSSFGNLTDLTTLYLSDNALSGKIPPELGNCKLLIKLQLRRNRLEGEIPSELGRLSNLRDLELFSNYLTGEIPVSIWKIQSLEHVIIYDNHLSGELPFEMTYLKNLQNISLYNNHLSGSIPRTLGINSSLVEIEFTNNEFIGEIPPYLCVGRRLRLLNMGLNMLSGGIPADVGRCSSLTRLILKKNNVTGNLPEFAENLNLLFMDLSGNGLHGQVPSSLGKCRNATSINLSENRLSGPVPAELGNLSELQSLNLSHNHFEGPLPSELSNCQKLLLFDVGFNSLNGSFPVTLRSWKALSVLSVRENRFTGGIPSFLSEYEMLSELHLGGNLFGGPIPSSIGSLQSLIYALDLSSNGLTGQLPAELGKLTSLQKLDVSSNNLSGSLTALDSMTSLLELNVSYNLFAGPIPPLLMKLLNLSSQSLLGNPGLCVLCPPPGGLPCIPNTSLKLCDLRIGDHHSLSKVQIAMIALGSSLIVVAIVLILSYLFLWCGRPTQDIEVLEHEGSSVLLHKIIQATDQLNDRYIVGKGAHGTVYKVPLGPNKVYAIKRLEFAEQRGVNNSMLREIQMLGKIRHRNLIKLEDFWLRNRYGYILYPFMENGSLHDLLHGRSPPPTLPWSVRYKIALGAANGLAYLHFDCNPAIVHRDVKPMNILLDSDMEPHISDFGIAKLLDQSPSSGQSLSVPGTTGYLAPENAFTTRMSTESDVYSYGVVLLELLTRKRALDPSFPEGMNIVGWTRSVWNNVDAIDLVVDPSILEEFDDSSVVTQVIDVLAVALQCTEKEARKRPTMREVVKLLQDASPSVK
ncbi:Receptor-like protein [Drosera capensis]